MYHVLFACLRKDPARHLQWLTTKAQLISEQKLGPRGLEALSSQSEKLFFKVPIYLQEVLTIDFKMIPRATQKLQELL